MAKQKTVFLGMSGGVDSSLSAVLLQQQGYRVVGVYMKNWAEDLPGSPCPWAEDLADAKRVAVKLGIDFLVFDFEKQYKSQVVDYMLAEFKAGRTPNPDVMCNQEIKFKLFYEKAKSLGADFIATGHYAKTDGKNLLLSADDNKDQTYFLYRISKDAISRTIFPLGDLKKPAVKKLAEKAGLPNAYKKESMGICFVGEVNIDDFLAEYFPLQPGDILEEETGKKLGTHKGSIFYTIGQRHGLYLGGGLPYYVVKKDTKNNLLYVSRNLNHPALWMDSLKISQLILRLPTKKSTLTNKDLKVRLRHRAPLIPVKLALLNSTTATLKFDQSIKRPAAGQSAVLYDKNICLGGGIIE